MTEEEFESYIKERLTLLMTTDRTSVRIVPLGPTDALLSEAISLANRLANENQWAITVRREKYFARALKREAFDGFTYVRTGRWRNPFATGERK